MNITITINTDNDAFSRDCRREVARILHELADRVNGIRNGGSTIYCDPGDTHKVRDINGNTVGEVTIAD